MHVPSFTYKQLKHNKAQIAKLLPHIVAILYSKSTSENVCTVSNLQLRKEAGSRENYQRVENGSIQ